MIGELQYVPCRIEKLFSGIKLGVVLQILGFSRWLQLRKVSVPNIFHKKKCE
jgi:hypothetical protein